MFVTLITILLTIVSMYCWLHSAKPGRSSKIWLWIAALLDHSRFYWYFSSPEFARTGWRLIPLA